MPSLEQEIYDQLVAVFPHGIKDITSLSYNDSDGRNFIASNEVGFNYDLLCNMSPVYPVGHKERTPDALFCVNDILCFVEFKEGDDKKPDIRLKIHEGIVSLFMFVQKYLPHITKEMFVSLRINYSVVVRAPACASTFKRKLKGASGIHQLRNLEGFLVQKTFYTVCPKVSAMMLGGLTAGKIKFIDIHERSGAVNRYNS